ncbi:MAG: hypothetical protein IKG39_05665 [Lachnospiraceae bacterium]|nr:hypothetical protein [Lachnospiraceae bacterium]
MFGITDFIIINAELLKSDRTDDSWVQCLFYPLRAKQLDDVTILNMLQVSFQMAERAVEKNCFSREEADAYLKEPDSLKQKWAELFR